MQQEHDGPHLAFTYRFLTSLLLFGLLAELLLPWLHAGEWSALIHPSALIWMAVFMLLIGLLQPRLFAFITAGIIIGMAALMLIYRRDDQSMWQWGLQLVPQLVDNFRAMLTYGIWFMSDELRTILLFIGWLLLVPSLQSMVWHYQLSLALFATVLVYLILLHMTLGFDVWLATVRVVAEGLLLLALTTFPKLQRKQLASHSWGIKFRYQYINILLLTIVVVAAGVLLSHNKVKDSVPVAWADLFDGSMKEEVSAWNQQGSGLPLKNMTSSNYRSHTSVSSGYSSDDSSLGQSVKRSDEVVFYGWSAIEHYWRGEALALYTGKGWSNEGTAVALHVIPEDRALAVAELEPSNLTHGITLEQEVTYITPQRGLPILQSGTKGVLLQLLASNPDRNLNNYIEEAATGALFAPIQDAEIKGYTVLTELPIANIDVLRQMKQPNEELAQRVWESEALKPYLQVPDELPERVAALSAEVSGGGWTSRYEQVKAIEQYLQQNYKYSLKSKMPGEHEDFVDHFLFEQQQGYCVHFATAMVIMLRTQDIPARYVKGYHMGEVIQERETEGGIVQTQYKVREQDAHAWVEVYFPSVGWVAFDPTPSATQSSTMSTLKREMNGLSDAIISKLNHWTASLSPLQWQLLGAGWLSSMLVGFLVVQLWGERKIKLLMLRYKRLLNRLRQLESMLEPAPLSRQRSSLQRKVNITIPRLREQAREMLLLMAECSVAKLESRYGVTGRALTWRQRVNVLLQQNLRHEQREAVERLLALVEQLLFSDEACKLPVANELRAELKRVNGRATAPSEESQRNNKLRRVFFPN